MENFDIKNKDQSEITKELKNDFKNFEDRKKGYDEELHDLGIKHLENYRKKINAAITKIGNIPTIDKQKHSAKCTELTNRLNAAKEEINNKTLKLNLGWMAYKFHHDEHLNAIGSAIDRYEDDAIDTIKNLIEDINDDEQIQAEKGNVDNANKQRTYVEIDDNGIYRLTKHTNRPRIHEVLGGVINEGELWKIDYSSCTNQYIKNKMASAISSSENYTNTGESYSCYLQYDKNQNTYVLSDGDGHVLQQRALIREGVQLTPPSKIKGEAKLAKREREQAQIDKVNNIELSDKDQAELLESMPEKMRNRLRQQDVNEFFRVTEESLNEKIIEAKQEGYILQSDPISKYDKNGYLMKLNLINGDSETSKPLIKNNFSSDVRKAFSKGQLKKYLTARVLKKWNDFDYLTKRGSVIDQTVDRGSDFINANQKAFSLKGLSMIGNWADAVFDKIGNTHLKDDDREFAALKIFVEDAKNDLNSQNITSKDIITIEAKLAEMLKKFFNNNFFRSSMQINENDIDGYIKDIISSGNEEKQIVAMRRMGASRTWFDNSQTAFLRDDIFDMHTRKKKQKVKTDEDGNPIYETDESGNSVPVYETDENGNPIYETDENGNPIYETDENGNFINEDTIDLQDDNFEHYFERINELYQVNPDTDVDENGEIKEPKKTYIDNLYTAATTNSGKHGVKNFKQRLVDQGLLPNWRGHGGQIDDKVRALKSQLEQQEKNSKKFEITGSEIKERTMQKLADLKLTLTSSQIQAAEQGDTGRDDQGIATLNALNFMLQQDDSFFQDLATKETKDTQKSIKYCGVDGVVRGNLAPYLIRRGGGLNSDSEIAQIYNDSVGASGWFDFSDEGAEKVGPILKDIIVEVVVTAVSILLSRNGAGEAIYIAFREAKLAVQAMKGFRKFIQFMKIFAKKLLKQALAQGLGKLRVGATKLGARTVGGAKAAADVVRAAETLGTWGKIAVKGTSLLIEGTTFHINSTIIHNIINGEDFWEGLDPLGYTEGPNGEKIPNRQSYAQSIAFLGILKGTGKVIGKLTGKSLQSLTGKEIQNIAKGRYGPAMVNKIFSTSLSLGSEMSSMMLTDQVLSLTFDQSLKPITGEELISMFGMIVGLRLNGKFQMKVKEYAGRKTTIRMAQEGTGNIFDVHIDREGNVLKVEGTDKNGKKIQNPQDVLGIKSGVEGQNLRQTHEGREVGTVKGDIKQLNNLHEGDVITVKHGESDVKFKKNKNGNWEIVDSGGITNERFNVGEEFIAKKNPDGSGYHLESITEGGPKVSLDGRVGVKLGDRSRGGTEPARQPAITGEPTNKDVIDQEPLSQRREELTRKKESHEKRKGDLEKRKTEIETRRAELLRQREENWRSLDGQENDIGKISDILEKGNVITIDGLKYKFNGIKNGKAEFVIDGNAKKSAESYGKSYSEKVEVSSLEELLSSHFNLEPGNKGTNSGRYAKLNELINDKVEPLDRLQNKIRNKKTQIETIQSEIARLEAGRNVDAFNDFFNANKSKLVGRSVWIAGVEYRATKINGDGSLAFMKVDGKVDGKPDFTISSFKQLTKQGGQWLGYADGVSKSGEIIKGSNVPKASETANHTLIDGLINGEKTYFDNRNIDAEIAQKQQQLSTYSSELSALEAELPKSQARQNAIQERARKGEEINKELRNLESELDGVNRELGETNRLINTYKNEIDGIEAKLSTEGGDREVTNREYNETAEPKVEEQNERGDVDGLKQFIKFDSQKEYTGPEDFAEIYRQITDKLREDPDNIYLKRRQAEILLASHYCDVIEGGEISCIDMNRGIYKLSTKKGDLFGSIYSIVDANASLLEYKPIADAIAFNENNLMGIKPDAGIKFSSTMVNSGSFAQANVHKYPADIDLAEHIKVTIEGNSNPQEVLSKLLVTHVQNHIKTMMNGGNDNLSFIEAKIGYSKTQKRSNGEPKSLKRSAEEILAGVHKGEGITLEEACKDPGFFKFDYTFIDANGIPKECTKVTSITIEQNGKVIQSNIGKGVGFQEVYFSSPEGYTVVDDIYKTENVDFYHNDFLKKDISHYREEGNALKVCKRLYNYVKTESGWTDTGRSCIEKLSDLFGNPILSGVSLVDGLEIGIRGGHDTGSTINLLREYGKDCLNSQENGILENNLKQIEQGLYMDTSLKEIKDIITKKVESTVLSNINSPENSVIKAYLNPIIENIEYNSGNNK